MGPDLRIPGTIQVGVSARASDRLTIRLDGASVKPKTQDVVVGVTGSPLHMGRGGWLASHRSRLPIGLWTGLWTAATRWWTSGRSPWTRCRQVAGRCSYQPPPQSSYRTRGRFGVPQVSDENRRRDLPAWTINDSAAWSVSCVCGLAGARRISVGLPASRRGSYRGWSGAASMSSRCERSDGSLPRSTFGSTWCRVGEAASSIGCSIGGIHCCTKRSHAFFGRTLPGRSGPKCRTRSTASAGSSTCLPGMPVARWSWWSSSRPSSSTSTSWSRRWIGGDASPSRSAGTSVGRRSLPRALSSWSAAARIDAEPRSTARCSTRHSPPTDGDWPDGSATRASPSRCSRCGQIAARRAPGRVRKGLEVRVERP